MTQVAFKPRVGRNKGGKMWDSPVLVEDQLFAMEMDDKTREVHSLPRGWDGGQSARAPATPGLTRARPGRLIPLTAFIREGREGVMHIITDARAECVCACVCVCECVCKPEKEERAYRWPDVNVNLAYPLQALGARWQQKQSKSLWNWFYNWLFINLFFNQVAAKNPKNVHIIIYYFFFLRLLLDYYYYCSNYLLLCISTT